MVGLVVEPGDVAGLFQGVVLHAGCRRGAPSGFLESSPAREPLASRMSVLVLPGGEVSTLATASPKFL